MARQRILIVDDEPHYLEWLEEFLVSQAYDVSFVETAAEAAKLTADEPFRVIIFDLNIPISGEMRELAEKRGEIYVKYPGLYLAWAARNAGYRDRQIIVYSVHRLDLIQKECDRLSCTYIAKGRPGIFKQELLEVLDYEPPATRRPTRKGEEKGSETGPRSRAGSKVSAPGASGKRSTKIGRKSGKKDKGGI